MELTHRVCLVTGANRGIGLAVSVALARAGAHVVLVGRDETRLSAALSEVRRTAGNDRGEYLVANGFGRLVIETLRVNPKVLGGLTEPQIVGIALIVGGSAAWLYLPKG